MHQPPPQDGAARPDDLSGKSRSGSAVGSWIRTRGGPTVGPIWTGSDQGTMGWVVAWFTSLAYQPVNSSGLERFLDSFFLAKSLFLPVFWGMVRAWS